jgi:hypothetical protein
MEVKNQTVGRYLFQDKGELTGIRSVLLFGKNTMSYKFALCDALMSLKTPGNTISYNEILPPFIDAFLVHYRQNPRQGTREIPFFNYCKDYLAGKISRQVLEDNARGIIHKYVFGAFQKVGGGLLKDDYLLFDWDSKTKVLTLRDQLLEILENELLCEAIRTENDTRWQIVEEAWKLGVSPGMICFHEESDTLVLYEQSVRINLRSAVDALMPYQKSICFYCPKTMNRFANSHDDSYPEVDHVLPLSRLRNLGFQEGNINGLWNLVCPLAGKQDHQLAKTEPPCGKQLNRLLAA